MEVWKKSLKSIFKNEDIKTILNFRRICTPFWEYRDYLLLGREYLLLPIFCHPPSTSWPFTNVLSTVTNLPHALSLLLLLPAFQAIPRYYYHYHHLHFTDEETLYQWYRSDGHILKLYLVILVSFTPLALNRKGYKN